MKKILFLPLLIFMALFTGCSSSSDDDNLRILDKTELEQKFYADQTLGTFTFKANDNWTASVIEVPAAKTISFPWITLSEYSGTAGQATIAVTLTRNYSGKSRSGIITVTSGGENITIDIKQDAVSKDGKVPKPNPAGIPAPHARLVSKISINHKIDGVRIYASGYTLEYDDLRRVRMMTKGTRSDPETILYVGYPDDNTVRLTSQYYDRYDFFPRSAGTGTSSPGTRMVMPGPSPISVMNVNARLNSEGYITSASGEHQEKANQKTVNWDVVYSDHYMNSLDYKLISGSSTDLYPYSFKWTSGNMVKADLTTYDDSWYTDIEYSDSDNTSQMNIDINWFITRNKFYCAVGPEGADLLGLHGKRSGKLLSRTVLYEGGIYPTNYTYTFDDQGCVTKCIVSEEEYDEVIEYTFEYL